MSSSTFKGERCGIENCRSRKYHVASDGYRYCENGHQHGALDNRADDDDNWNHQGKTTKRKREEQELGTKLLTGRPGFERYLYCYQIVLWKQSHWLVHEKGLPAELEVVIKDLWALRLQSLKTRVETSDTESQSQLFSSQSEAGTDTEQDKGKPPGRRGMKTSARPRLIDTLALCYLGALLLRLPLSLGDLFKWASGGEMIYYRARECVPAAMLANLMATYHAALEATVVIKPDDLQTAILDLATGYYRDFGMTIPALNHPLVLFRYIKDLALPLEVYPTVIRLARLVEYDFTFPDFASRRRLRLSDLPEAQLVALLVVAVKLYHPFDGPERHPFAATDAGAMVVDWQTWAKAAKKFEGLSRAPGRLEFEQAFNVTDKDVMAMNDTELDDYLNWYERLWVKKDDANEPDHATFRGRLFEWFPTGPSESQKKDGLSPPVEEEGWDAARKKRLRAVQGSLKSVKVVPEDDPKAETAKRPGSFYKQYRYPKELNGVAKAFYEAAAKQAGLSLEALVKAVFVAERKLVRWVNLERRMESRRRVELLDEERRGAELLDEERREARLLDDETEDDETGDDEMDDDEMDDDEMDDDEMEDDGMEDGEMEDDETEDNETEDSEMEDD